MKDEAKGKTMKWSRSKKGHKLLLLAPFTLAKAGPQVGFLVANGKRQTSAVRLIVPRK